MAYVFLMFIGFIFTVVCSSCAFVVGKSIGEKNNAHKSVLNDLTPRQKEILRSQMEKNANMVDKENDALRQAGFSVSDQFNGASANELREISRKLK